MTESYDYPHSAYDLRTYPGTFFSESSSASSHCQHYNGSDMTPTTIIVRPKSEKKRSSRFRFFRCSWAIPRLLNSDAKGGIERRGHPVSKSQKNLDFFFRRPADTRQARGAKPPK